MRFELATLRASLPLIATSFVFALFIVLLPRYTDSAKTFYMLLILGGFFFLLFNPREIFDTSTPERLFLGAVLLNFIWIAFCYYVNGAPERGNTLLWSRHFYFIFLVPLFFLFRRIEISPWFILICIGCSVAISTLDIAIDIAQGINHRLQGMNPNGFAPIQVCFFWTLFFYLLWEQDRRIRFASAVGCGLAIVAIVASGSKGAWASFLLTAVFFVFYLAPIPTSRKILLTLALVMLSSSLYLLPFVQKRVDQLAVSVNGYFGSDKHENWGSLGTFGLRMELWKEAYNVFLDRPFVGAGLGGVKQMVEANRERYQTSEYIARHKYVHNQYLSALATRGFPGLLLLLAILILPLYIAMSNKSLQREKRVASMSIVCIFLVYAFGNIFESHFEVKSAIMFISVMLPLWLAQLSTPRERQSTVTDIT